MTPPLWSVGKMLTNGYPDLLRSQGEIDCRNVISAAVGNYGVPEGRTYQSGPRSNIL